LGAYASIGGRGIRRHGSKDRQDWSFVQEWIGPEVPKKMPMPEKATLTTHLCLCQECRRPWLEPQERWRLYLTEEEPVEAVPYCPSCAAREFDPD
jgi:hypothetical protein